ncbi:MAG: malonate decarboxylase holo-ACP synthase [Gammaproteobacteria bacterium]|nr:malonate decarboxylase holo-ACP synthase [Gammaproteobacteria bacterium]
MPPEPGAHTLLRIAGADSLHWAGAPPAWALSALACAPWVVVRRARGDGVGIAVGVRGAARAERLAAWLHPDQVLECLTPADLAARRGWSRSTRRAQVPALAALDAVDALLRAHGLAWGPCGSVGFELASGTAAAGPTSDLDITVPAPQPLARAVAAALLASLARLAVRVDVQLEVPQGAVALAEYAHARGSVALRTVEGVRLVSDPWAAHAGAAA